MNTGLPAERKTFKFIPERLAEDLESRGVSPNKAFEYLVLFAGLTAIYYFFFMRSMHKNVCGLDLGPGAARVTMLNFKFFFFTAWPFTVIAAFDPSWRSKDAGNVFLPAYAAACVISGHVSGCAFCIFAASVQAVPYLLGAWIAHGIGAYLTRFRQKG